MLPQSGKTLPHLSNQRQVKACSPGPQVRPRVANASQQPLQAQAQGVTDHSNYFHHFS